MKGVLHMKYNEFRLNQVKLSDSYCENAHEKMLCYLLELEPDRILAGFRENAGLDMRGQKRYAGWENSLIGGHTMGHYLTALSQAYASWNTPEEKKELLYLRITYIVDSLADCQASSKGKEGFLWGATIADVNHVESQFDAVEEGKTDIFKHSWVPWYTMHKILSGLMAAYELANYEEALTVARRLGDWVSNRAMSWDEAQKLIVLRTEYGGMNDAMYELYQLTKEETYVKAAHQFDEEKLFTKIREAKKDYLNNHHANTAIPKVLGALHRYEAIGDLQALDTAKSFWNTVTKQHTYATGDNSENEHFGCDDQLAHELTNCNCETCNAYNMLKLTRRLFCSTGEIKYADFYERAFLNTILASQNPDTGMTTYFQPMANGYFKVFGQKFDKFWCCTGSGMESMTKLNDSIYFQGEEQLVVNLYLSSTVETNGLTVIQNSSILKDGKSTFTIHTQQKGVPYTIKLRSPSWCDGTISVQFGTGDFVQAQVEDGYVCINRTWSDGDCFEVTIPMTIKANQLPDDEVYAFTYGPIVLCADMGDDAMETEETGVNVTIPKLGLDRSNRLVLQHGITKTEFFKHLNDHFIRTGMETEWVIKGTTKNYRFVPYYSMYQRRYGIHWHMDETL